MIQKVDKQAKRSGTPLLPTITTVGAIAAISYLIWSTINQQAQLEAFDHQVQQAPKLKSDRHFIIRTAWVYGAKGKGNFVKTMLRLGVDREELRVVTAQIGAPTWSKDLAGAIAQLAPNSQPKPQAPNTPPIAACVAGTILRSQSLKKHTNSASPSKSSASSPSPLPNTLPPPNVPPSPSFPSKKSQRC